jgi:ACR3 family arsenite transporter
VIALIAVPILIQSYGIFALAYAAAWAWKVPHRIAAPCALIGTSNFFELAVAVAISLFGLNSGAALATVVGVLVEVPVMLSLVAFANRTRSAFGTEEGEAAAP